MEKNKDIKKIEENKNVVLAGKIWAMMGYLWVLCLVPLILNKDNPFALFHAKQGLVLFIASIICVGITVIPVLGFIGVVGNITIFVVSITGIISALKGECREIPVIGEYARKIEL